MIELINYCLGGDGGDGPGENPENPGGKWTKQLTECAKKKKRRIVHREKLRTLEVNREELRKLEVQQEKLNADRGEGDCIKFDLGDEDTFDVKECPVGPYLEGLSFEEIHKILTTKELQKDLPVCKKTDGKPDPECIQVLHRTIVWKDVCKACNVKICSHEHVLKHSDAIPALTKKQLRQRKKSIFDSSQPQYDFRTNPRERVLNTIFKVHKDVQTAGTDKARIKYQHLKIYDKQGVFRLSKFRYGFEYDYAHQVGRFSHQTKPSWPNESKEDDFTLLYQSKVSVWTGVELVEKKLYHRRTDEVETTTVCTYRFFTIHPSGIGNPNEDLQPSKKCREFKQQDHYFEEEKKEEEKSIYS